MFQNKSLKKHKNAIVCDYDDFETKMNRAWKKETVGWGEGNMSDVTDDVSDAVNHV